LAQLEGSGRGALASYNKEQYQVLFSHLQEASLSDSHVWLEQLMRKDKALGEQKQRHQNESAASNLCNIATAGCMQSPWLC
jgi:hypothetical protein